jgi:hypothetical protein
MAKSMRKGGIFYDLKSLWKAKDIESAGLHYLSL